MLALTAVIATYPQQQQKNIQAKKRREEKNRSQVCVCVRASVCVIDTHECSISGRFAVAYSMFWPLWERTNDMNKKKKNRK